ncbi:hypothetical protein OAA61_04085 [Candidatus Pelagibacter ubique]|nr:hypothetical protein [Candidatus Pelagibacter ubique]
MLTLFTTTVAAKELVMRCNENIYKYVEDPSGDKVFWKHKKKTKNKYEEWCTEAPTDRDIKNGMLAKEGWTRIIKNNKSTCLVKKITWSNPTDVWSNLASVTDFVKIARHVEYYANSKGSKKNILDIACKKL